MSIYRDPNQSHRGFTLIELSVVIAVVSILYAVTLYLLKPDVTKASVKGDRGNSDTRWEKGTDLTILGD